MRRSICRAISISCIVIPTLAVADLDCTGQQNGEQQIGGCWNCEEDIKGAPIYSWSVTLGSGALTVNNSDQTKAVYACAEDDNIRANIAVTFTAPPRVIATTDIDGLQCRTRTGNPR